MELYAWGQDLQYIHSFLQLPESVKGRDIIVCTLHRTSMEICNATGELVFGKDFFYPITVDDSTWQLEDKGIFHGILLKEHGSREKTPGFEWWPSPFIGEPTISVESCHVGTDMRDLPAFTKKEMEKAMWEERQKTSEERAADEEQRQIEAQMAAEKARIDASVEKAMSNPQKKAIYEMMQEKFPDLPVEFR